MKKSLPLVSIITVNYNGKKYLKNCFNSLFALNYPKNKLEIFMVDNCSQDGSVEYVKNNFPKVKVIKNDVNNYCKANNLGIAQAQGQYIATLNNDTKVDKNWLMELVKVIDADKNLGAAGSKLLFMDGRIQSAGHEELPNFYWVDRGCTEEDRNQYNEIKEVCSLCAGAALYRKSALKEINNFDEDFNMYLEDVDISLRLKRKKWKLLYVPESIVYHRYHGTISDNLALFYVERNRLLLLAKHYPKKLSDVLLGRGYFTVQRDVEAQGALYEMLSDVILKLTKHHRREVVKDVLNGLFAELRKISNYENIILVDKFRHLLKSVESQQEIIGEKDKHIASLGLEIANREDALTEKDRHIGGLNLEVVKRDQEISNLTLENKNKNQALAAKDQHINSLNLELSNIYNSTVFRWLVRPLWSILWKVKQGIKRLSLSRSRDAKLDFGASAALGGGKIDLKGLAICTIISKNYLAYARVLTESFLQYNQGEVFVLLTDKIDGYFDPQKEKFTLIEIDALKDRIPDFEKIAFKYNLTELNTAVKPYFLEFLFEKFQTQKLIFFDPDILITHGFGEISNLLDKYSIILIPHITQPFQDNHKPKELEILRSGVYNLGFLALSDTDSTRKLIKWWKERLLRYCRIDFANSMFVDQKWMELIPGFFEDVFILRDPTYNIAYWNMHYRKVYLEKENILINGRQAHFLHFSGFNPDKPKAISKHQDRFRFGDLKEMKPVFELYKNKLISYGHNNSKNWPCIFEYFDNQIKIPDIVRKIYAGIENDNNSNFGNPFHTAGKKTYFNWLNEGVDNKTPKITQFMYEIYKERTDVQFSYTDIFGADREGFLNWFLTSLGTEYNLDAAFLNKAYPFNLKKGKRFTMGLKTKAFYKSRGMLKIFLKKIFRNNLWMINNLRTTELRGYRKMAQINMLLYRKKGHNITKENIKGINLIGYLTSELGIGEGVRANVKCLKSAGVSFSLINIDNHSISRKHDFSFSDFSSHNPYDINLIHVNADMFPKLYVEKGTRFFKDKYNIGFWTWELPDFPDEWLNSFNYCNEVWAPSSFVLTSVSKKSPLTVVKIPHAVEIDNVKNVDRSFFGLKDSEFIFLFIFDFFSFFERKNPLAVIRAFKKAFLPSQDVRLVIKCINPSYDPSAFEIMQKEANGLNVSIMDNYLYRDEVNALVSLCDCYISLHRSEGFGLTIAEAMYLGKPVIATGYSGNMDFMNINNSFLVKYKLIEIPDDAGPYKKGGVWADPDIGHAAELMGYVYESYEAAKDIGNKASAYIRTNLNYNLVGKEIKNRLNFIYENKI